MGNKLERIYGEVQRTEAKLDGYKARLADLNAAMKLEEDAEIVRTFRKLKLNGRELIDALKGIKEGTVTLQPKAAPADNVTEGQPQELDKGEVHEKGAQESEDKKSGK